MKRVALSVLDLAPIVEGGTARDAFEASRALAVSAEKWGYLRYWVAEHHGMPGIASAATSLLIARAAEATSTIRVGAGGIMLPNHSPLVIAEQFGTLESLYPGRVDLGLGRAPGSDPITARALRRNSTTNPEAFIDDVAELQMYFGEVQPDQLLQAVPGAGLEVPLWILGSSTFGAQVAAHLGLPFAFASHFAPKMMHEALRRYRTQFRPSKQLRQPYVMLGYNVFAGESEGEAMYLASSMKQAFVQLRVGRPGKLPAPVEGFDDLLSREALGMLDEVLSCSAIGTADQVAAKMRAFAEETAADEIIVASMIHDVKKRLRSVEIASQAFA